MLRKVTFIRPDDTRQSLLHRRNIPRLRPHQDRLRHTTGNIIHLQFFIQWIEKGIRNRFNGIHAFQIRSKVFITISKQKFRKCHRVNLHEINLTDRKRGRLRQGNPQQRTSTGNMILRRVLTEILHGIDDLRAVLHLIKDNKRFFRQDFLTACQHQILQDTVNILCCLEELLVFLVFIKVEISRIFIITSAKLLQNPCFPHLTHAFQNQGLAVGGILPVQQFFQNKSFHKLTPHTFIGVFVFYHHIFIISQGALKYNGITKLL